MSEEWRAAVGWPRYLVSSLGRVRGPRGELGGFLDSKRGDYLLVGVSKGTRESLRLRPIHRLVAEAFLGAPPSRLHQVNHKDGVKTNNAALNLEWTTPRGNMRHARDMGLLQHGERHYKAVLTESQVLEILHAAHGGEAAKNLSARFGVSTGTIYAIRSGTNWRSLTDDARRKLDQRRPPRT